MARKARPWFWAERNAYYIVRKGERVRLGDTKEEAEKEWHKICAADDALRAGENNAVEVCIDAYLAFVRREQTVKSYQQVLWCLGDFKERFGTIKVKSLKRHHVTTWFEAHTTWGANSLHTAQKCLMKCLNWCVGEGILPYNPLHKRLKSRPEVSRGAECLMPRETFDRFVALTDRLFGEFLTVVYETGARPSEIARLTADNYMKDAKMLFLRTHKTDKSGRPRLIHLTDKCVETIERLVAKYPSGVLFRNGRGNAWDSDAWGGRIRTLRKKLGVPKTVVLYGARHQFATDLLKKGVADVLVASLLGHTGTKTLHKTYSHVDSAAQALRDALKCRE